MNQISIIVPTYNRERALENAIQSVVNQSFSSWELIVVDDGSTDNTGELMLSYTQRDGRIKYLRQSNQGAPSARNEGLSLSSAPWVLFLDSDDELLPNAVDLFFSTSRDQRVVYHGGFFLSRGEEHLEYEAKEVISRQEFVYGNPIVCLPAVFFYRDYLPTPRAFDEGLLARQDADLYYRLGSVVTFVPLPFAVCIVHLGGQDRIGANPQNRLSGWVEFYKRHNPSFEIRSHIKLTRKLLSHALKRRDLSVIPVLLKGWARSLKRN